MKLDLFEIISALNLPAPVGVLQVGASYGQEIIDRGSRFAPRQV